MRAWPRALLARLVDALILLVVPIAAIAIWWVASQDSTSPFYPPLETIVEAFEDTWLFERFGSDVVPSLRRLFAGYALAVAVGVGVGALLGRIPTLHRAFNPLVQFGRAIPATALVPVGIVLLGIGDAPKIYLIAFVSLFPILLNTIDGVRSVEPGIEDVARSFRLTRTQRVLAVQLPSAAPQVVSGMRIALGIAFIMMVVSEMVAATSGIGFLTLTAQQSLAVPEMWSGMILLGLLGAVINYVFVVCERRLLRWHYSASEGS
jgi:ABC-type nitrate/sulfonate/bicarbonate transport system permease component